MQPRKIVRYEISIVKEVLKNLIENQDNDLLRFEYILKESKAESRNEIFKNINSELNSRWG